MRCETRSQISYLRSQISNLIKKMAKIRIKQTKSGINRTERQKRTLQALGLTKMQQVVEKEANPQINGMIAKVAHLVTVETI